MIKLMFLYMIYFFCNLVFASELNKKEFLNSLLTKTTLKKIGSFEVQLVPLTKKEFKYILSTYKTHSKRSYCTDFEKNKAKQADIKELYTLMNKEFLTHTAIQTAHISNLLKIMEQHQTFKNKRPKIKVFDVVVVCSLALVLLSLPRNNFTYYELIDSLKSSISFDRVKRFFGGTPAIISQFGVKT